MNEIRIKLGELIKLERKRRGISLEDFSSQLKISMSHLESIESGDASRLPSELYFNLFSKSCCEALGIDFTRTVEAIKIEVEATPPEVKKVEKEVGNKKPEKTNDERSELLQFKKLGYIFGSIVVIFILFLAVYIFFLKDDRPVSTQITTSSETMDEVSAETTKTNIETANYDWNVPAYSPPEPLTLKLRAKSESWATILADGDTVLFRSLLPDRDYDLTANYRFLISVGIPRFVEIELNGHNVDLADPETRKISKVLIDQVNVNDILFPKEKKDSTENTDITDMNKIVNTPATVKENESTGD